jgi:GH35 family endo-1,4-beta-xylanase
MTCIPDLPCIVIAALFACLCFAGPARADLPAGGEDVVDAASFSYRGAEADGRADIPTAANRADPIRFETLRRTDYPWDLAIQTKSTAAIDKGDVLLFTARIRAISTASETGDARIEVVFEQSAPPYDKSLIARAGFKPDDGWKTVYFPFEAQRRYAVGEAQVSLRPGFGKQVLEIADVRVINYRKTIAKDALPITRATYAGREGDARWRIEANERIEKIRKGDLRIRVVDAQGDPVPNVVVHVQMRRHAYAFGSAVAAKFLLQPGPDGDKYREHVQRLFNRVVIENDLKWPAWDADRTPALDALRWLKEHDIPVRGHNLVWPSWKYTPKWLKTKHGDDRDALRKIIADHVTEEATATRGLVVEWDVVNEPFTERDILNVLGDDVMADWFKLARAADPDAKLYLNDFPSLGGGKHLDHFEATISRLRALGAPLDGIGVQCHYGADLVEPVQLLASLDRLSRFGLPIQATEFDIESSDETLQGDYFRDHLIAFFSHPSTSGVMIWGFWEGRHWRPSAAIYRTDWTPRPAGEAWNDLIYKQWWTDVKVNTDDAGRASVRGFCGLYDITAEDHDRRTTQSLQLTRDGSDIVLTLP